MRTRKDSEALFAKAQEHSRGAARKLKLADEYFTAALRALERERQRERERAADAIVARSHCTDAEPYLRHDPKNEACGCPGCRVLRGEAVL